MTVKVRPPMVAQEALDVFEKHGGRPVLVNADADWVLLRWLHTDLTAVADVLVNECGDVNWQDCPNCDDTEQRFMAEEDRVIAEEAAHSKTASELDKTRTALEEARAEAARWRETAAELKEAHDAVQR